MQTAARFPISTVFGNVEDFVATFAMALTEQENRGQRVWYSVLVQVTQHLLKNARPWFVVQARLSLEENNYTFII